MVPNGTQHETGDAGRFGLAATEPPDMLIADCGFESRILAAQKRSADKNKVSCATKRDSDSDLCFTLNMAWALAINSHGCHVMLAILPRLSCR